MQGALLRTPSRVGWLLGHRRGLRNGRAPLRSAELALLPAAQVATDPIAGGGRQGSPDPSSAGIERTLRWLGEPVDPPTLAPARDPPFFKSQVIRWRLGEPAQASCSTRTEMRSRPTRACIRWAVERSRRASNRALDRQPRAAPGRNYTATAAPAGSEVRDRVPCRPHQGACRNYAPT